MSIYKKPASNLYSSDHKMYNPTKGVLFALCISVLGPLILFIINSTIFFKIFDFDKFNFNVLKNYFLILHILFSSFICYCSGKVAAKYVSGKEIKYGIIVSVLTVLINMLWEMQNETSRNPTWYYASYHVAITLSILFGAISRITKSKELRVKGVTKEQGN